MVKFKRLFQILICVLLFSLFIPAKVTRAENVELINSTFLSDINALRASKGLNALTIDSSLTEIASVRAQEATTTWSHTRPNGTQGIAMIPANKWRGENLAYVQYGAFTYTDLEQVSAESLMFSNLKASPTHYKNMVFDKFTKVGIYTYVSTTSSGYKITTAFMFSN